MEGMQTHSSVLISVIIPTYNRANSIIDTIQSVVKQNIEALEILICDDFSTDNTEDVVNEYSKKYKNIKLLRRQDKGKGANYARNNGIENACGKYLVFLDSDDVLTEKSLSDRLKVFEDNPNIDLVYGDVEVGNFVHRFDKIQDFDQNSYIWEELSLCPFSVMMMKKDVFPTTPLLDVSLPSWQDDNMILNLHKCKKKFFHCGKVVASMRRVDSNISSNYWKRYNGLKKIISIYKGDVLKEKGLWRLFLWKLRLLSDYFLAKETDSTNLIYKTLYKISSKVLFSICAIFFRHIYG